MPPKRPRIVGDRSSGLRWISEETQKNYEKFWKKRAVCVEREWHLEDFGEENGSNHLPRIWKNIIEERGWGKLVRFTGDCRKNLVREFFANVIDSTLDGRRSSISSMVRGVRVEITCDVIDRFFELTPLIEEPQYEFGSERVEWSEVEQEILFEGAQWGNSRYVRKSDLKWRYLPLHESSCCNLLPLARTADVSRERGRLLHAIGTGLTIDISQFIFMQLYNVHIRAGDAQAAIPFGVFLSTVILQSGVRDSEDLDVQRPIGPIDASIMATAWIQI